MPALSELLKEEPNDMNDRATGEQIGLAKMAKEEDSMASRHYLESTHDDHDPQYQQMHRIAGKMKTKIAEQYRRMAAYRRSQA